jgi:hypothetical protein
MPFFSGKELSYAGGVHFKTWQIALGGGAVYGLADVDSVVGVVSVPGIWFSADKLITCQWILSRQSRSTNWLMASSIPFV